MNYVKEIYAPFSDGEISEMITPKDCSFEIEAVYQTIEGLHKACPHHSGDWCFSSDYPTPGGTRLVNFAYIAYYEGTNKRMN